MSLFSLFRKNKQETRAEDSAYLSRAETDSTAPRPRKRKSANRTDSENAPVDPVLPEKKRARRRLVGAVALVLAVVIGLPMVLDSEPKPLADDVTIDIPSKDKPAAPARGAAAPSPAAADTSKDGRNGPGSRAATAAGLDQKEELIELPVVPKAAATAPAAAVAPAVPAAALAKKPEPAPSKAAPAAKSKTEPVASAATDKAGDAARAKAILEAGSDAKSAKFIVQVAALASTEKVNELRGKLKDAGIASYTQKIATDSGERIRIRIGPLGSREEADKVRAKLAALGLNGTLVPSTL